MNSSTVQQVLPGSASGTPTSLADLFDDAEEFHRKIFGQQEKVAYSHTVQGLLSAEQIWHELDCGALIAPYFEVLDGETQVAAEDVTETRLVQTRPRRGYANAAAIKNKVVSGSTLRLVQLEHWHPAIQRLVTGLAEELQSEVRSSAYLSLHGTSGTVSPHDDSHVLVIQLEGQTDWAVGGAITCAQITLQPGGVLYIPQQYTRRYVPGNTGSLHLAITIQPPTVRDIAELALTRFLQSAEVAKISLNHQLMSVTEKVEWMRTNLCSYLRTQDPVQLARAASQIRQRKGQA